VKDKSWEEGVSFPRPLLLYSRIHLLLHFWRENLHKEIRREAWRSYSVQGGVGYGKVLLKEEGEEAGGDERRRG
jgi:hypothetical protein